MLYSDVDTCAMIDGRAYRRSNEDSESVPNDNGEYCAFITGTKLQKNTYYHNRYRQLYVIYDDVMFVYFLYSHLHLVVADDFTSQSVVSEVERGDIDILSQVDALFAV